MKLFRSTFVVDWVNEARFLVSKGEDGLTGNLYCGFMDYEDMAFLIHYLKKEEDTFYDIGANVGAYTILASSVAKAKTICFEPVPSTYNKLIDQIKINRIDHLVDAKNYGVGHRAGTLQFTSNFNCTNKVNTDPKNKDVTEVEVVTLDDFFVPTASSIVKIDVEGYEKFVLEGGASFFSKPSVSALIIELNGSGVSFGVEDDDLHDMVTSYGFQPVRYDPLSRKISLLKTYAKGENTIYVKDVEDTQLRVSSSAKFCVLTANNFEL
jgi:FkbM family methyltransferase